jgi:hypothetical protein
MITKTTKSGKEIVFYASIKEMPIKLHNIAQRYILQDMGLGSDINAIDEHFKALDSQLSAGKLQEAMIERENQRFAFFSMLQRLNYKSLSFGCHIHSIDGKEITDRSEEALTALLDDLDITVQDADEILSEVKKNFSLN